MVLPTFILEKRSLLEMYADFMSHPDLSWPSPMAPARWTAWSDLWSITSHPSMKVAKVPLPRSPTTPSSERPSTALGKYPKRQRLRQQSQKKGPHARQTATMSALWLSRFPIIHLCQASMQNARRDRWALTRTCGPRASSWACPLASLWLEKVSVSPALHSFSHVHCDH